MATNSNFSTLGQNPVMALAVQDIYTASATKLLPLGSRIDLADGRSFVYAQAGATELAYGKISQSPIPSANWDNCATVAPSVAIGDQAISVTFGGAVTANFFRDGFLLVNDAVGEGQMYTVKSHAAGTAGVVVYLYEKVRVALTAATSEVTLYPNPNSQLIIAPTTLTAALHGVPLCTVPIDNYAWFQVRGACPVLVAATLSLATTCECATTAGGVIPTAETTFGPVVGMPLILAAATEYAIINLSIPGY